MASAGFGASSLDRPEHFRLDYAKRSDLGKAEFLPMAMRLGKLYDALVQAGATNATAGDAAEEVAGFDTRMQAIERRLSRLEALQWATFVAAAAILVRVYWP